MKIKKYLSLPIAGYLAALVLNRFIPGGSQVGQVITVIQYILLVCSAILTLLFLYKKMNAAKVLKKASIRDGIWSETKLKVAARDSFYRIQSSWETGDVTPLKDFTTPEFLELFASERSIDPSAANELIGLIDITLTDIIACRDFIHNDGDRFTAHLTGVLKVYDKQGDHPARINEFSEMYHFVRSGNNWLLDKVTGEHQLLHFILLKSFSESQ